MPTCTWLPPCSSPSLELETDTARRYATRTALDEPTDLPEGTEVELTAVFDDDLGPEER